MSFAKRHYKAVYWSILVGRTAALIALVIVGGYWSLALGALLAFASFYEGLTSKERADAEVEDRLTKSRNPKPTP